MPDYIVCKDTPPIYTAATPKAAIAMALAQMPDYKDATGSFSCNLWVGTPNGTLVNATVTVNTTRSLQIDIAP